MLVLTSYSSLYSVGDPRPWDVPPTFKMGLLTSVKIIPHGNVQSHLLGDPRSCQVVSQY